MPSRFPGMDPFIENQAWEDFHTSFLAALRDELVQRLRPNYVVQVERRVYLESHDPETNPRSFVADAAVYRPPRLTLPSEPTSDGGVAIVEAFAIEAFSSTVPCPHEIRENYLVLRRGREHEIVTVIELLSPANKRKETDGRKVYTDKRLELMQTRSNLVELDLLRGGKRMQCEPQPPGDYYALVSRPRFRPVVEIYPWSLAHRLPVIPIPLAQPDPDVRLDLQSIFDTVYDRAGYDYSLDYSLPIQPKWTESEEAWFQSLNVISGSQASKIYDESDH